MSTTKLKSVKLRSNSSLVVKSEFQGLEDGDVIVSSVDSLHETEEAMDTWVCASIDSIIDNWWYLACKRCNSKMNCEDGDMYCTKCTNTRGTARYKIQFGVHDCTASGVFLCWDRECEMMIGKSCEILKREVSLLKNKVAFDLPNDLEDLVGRTFLFNVRIKPNDTFSTAFSVLRVIVDSNFVSKYNHWVVENDESDFLTLLQREEATKDDDEEEVISPLKVVRDVEQVSDTSNAKRNLMDGFAIDREGGQAKSVTSKKGKAKVDEEGNLLPTEG
ncbi:Unknown protein [Striga hermonthica]|uniref:Replication factor A C-terminal domain-containing protein n=1 Tax=Striga hermonthica TaxID=68872 RepID=A0A9N7MN70_STRHE|nr:Unknown protein [Striga hermonthica]